MERMDPDTKSRRSSSDASGTKQTTTEHGAKPIAQLMAAYKNAAAATTSAPNLNKFRTVDLITSSSPPKSISSPTRQPVQMGSSPTRAVVDIHVAERNDEEEQKGRTRTTTRVARVFSNQELKQLQTAWTATSPTSSPVATEKAKEAPLNRNRRDSPTGNGSRDTVIGSRNSAILSPDTTVRTVPQNALHRSASDISLVRPNLAIDNSASIDPNAKVKLTIMSSTTFATGVFSKTRGAKVYYLLDVQRNGTRAGMLLRNYKHFAHFHQRFENALPAIASTISLPKMAMISSDAQKELLQKDLQEYLNKLSAVPEVMQNSCMTAFLDPAECPLLVYLNGPEKEGMLKMSSGILSSWNWTEVWLVVKHKRLYYYLDKNPSAVPIGYIGLQYATISFTIREGKEKQDYTFEIQDWKRNKGFSFKVKDEQERNEWVTMLRNVKAKVTGEIEANIPVPSDLVEVRQSTITITSKILQEYVAGTVPGSPRGTTRQKHDKYRKTSPVSEDDSESNLVLNQKKSTIKGASVDKLLEKLTEEEQDMDFVLALLLTYRSFTTPANLLESCVQRFINPPATKQKGTAQDPSTVKSIPIHPTQLRVCTVLMKWIEVNFHEFETDDKLAKELIFFIEYELVPVQRFQVMGKKLKDLLKKKVNQDKLNIVLAKPPQPELPPLFTSKTFDLLDLSSLEVARQMTLIEFDLFCAVEPKECLGQKWTKKHLQDQAPHIMAFIRRFNQVSNWVVTKIVNIEEKKPRVAMLTKFIEIAQHCMQFNNYNSAMEILSGLNSSAVYRLTKSFEALSPTLRANFEKIKEQLAHDGSYKNLRDLLHNRQPPCIPYFGLYLTDLVFIDDGNPDKLDNNLWNFEKNYLLYKVIKEIQLYQQTAYCFQPVEEIQNYLLDIKFYDEATAYALSLKCQPRDPNQ